MNSQGRPRRRLGEVCFLCISLIVICGCSSPDDEQLLNQARDALSIRDYKSAEDLAASVSQASPLRFDALMIAGEAAMRGRNFEGARGYFQTVADSPSSQTLDARFYLAEVLRELKLLSEAVAQYQRVLKDEPLNIACHERLAFLESMAGRRWESENHYFALVQSGSATLQELALFADLDRPIEPGEYLDKCIAVAPDDRYVRLATAQSAIASGDRSAAVEILREELVQFPDDVSTLSALGVLISESSDGELVAWNESLPEHAESHPDVWYVRGRWASHSKEFSLAEDCLLKALELAPQHRQAMYLLIQTITASGEPPDPELVQRSEALLLLSQQVDHVLRSDGKSEESVRSVVELLESTGRIWETCAWSVYAKKQFPAAIWPDEFLAEYGPLLDDDLDVVSEESRVVAAPSDDPAKRFASFVESRRGVESSSSLPSVAASAIQFEELPLDFIYENGADDATSGARMFEQTGGGVGVLDFDCDGRMDLFFPQGGDWPTGHSVPQNTGRLTDAIFRNLGSDEFRNVADAAGFSAERDFGQGVAIGDFDQDGFADIYVANVGKNALYWNAGDGTFLDVSEQLAERESKWTASVAIADLNGDSNPDLFDVNYLEGPRVYELICQGKACSPSVFEGAADDLLISNGSGEFETCLKSEVSEQSKGLGIVVIPETPPELPSLFIACDQVANQLLEVKVGSDAKDVRLENRALVSGVAFNHDGLAMACMGVALGDVNRDGTEDLLVTNFEDEFNTLYLRHGERMFVDSTRYSGLMSPSFPKVGWGTQFLDADHDGWLDLIVANGHVDDYRDTGGEFAMNPQFFRNVGDGRFEEIPAEMTGEFFKRKQLGRGLAVGDFNQDGLRDAAVSLIHSNASILLNTTENHNHHLNVKLVGVQSSRDAVGARVIVKVNDVKLSGSVTAGDGYMASNEKSVNFGLGNYSEIESIVIHWPSGLVTEIDSPPVDGTLLVIESDANCYFQSVDGEAKTVSCD
ncbi:FG-GAP-like repeat-containing protein [Thalassoglobus neptunius]|uniref:FG-GAP-like repeat-containing protein n=1 Tax=Thalassoglobus neptunius TaxID=1938619 RepID=UPI0018D24020|nr:FG-GAP-like repeat-containing protein [Thalassoglobus neptunius]